MKLWLWGDNSDGFLGDGTEENRSSPVQTITGGSTWKVAHVGYDGVIALKDDGSLWTWGDGGHGVLGNLATHDVSSPVHIAEGKTWKSIGGSNYYWGVSCAIDTSDKLYIWGYNDEGGLGLNDTVERSSPTQLGTKNWKQAAASA
jgi:alpha-tubulin suppressor-like RCC1 family protein